MTSKNATSKGAGPTARDPQVKPSGRNIGTPDYSGQDPYEESQSEGVADAPELVGLLKKAYVPTIDDPGRHAEVTVYQSDDPRLHLSRMSGEDPPNPVGYRGPDRRHV